MNKLKLLRRKKLLKELRYENFLQPLSSTSLCRVKKYSEFITIFKKKNRQFVLTKNEKNAGVSAIQLFQDGYRQWTENKTTNKSLKIDGVTVRITNRTYTLRQQPNYVRVIYKVKEHFLFQYWGNNTGDIKPDIFPLIQETKLHFEDKASASNLSRNLSNCYYFIEDLTIGGSECQ